MARLLALLFVVAFLCVGVASASPEDASVVPVTANETNNPDGIPLEPEGIDPNNLPMPPGGFGGDGATIGAPYPGVPDLVPPTPGPFGGVDDPNDVPEGGTLGPWPDNCSPLVCDGEGDGLDGLPPGAIILGGGEVYSPPGTSGDESIPNTDDEDPNDTQESSEIVPTDTTNETVTDHQPVDTTVVPAPVEAPPVPVPPVVAPAPVDDYNDEYDDEESDDFYRTDPTPPVAFTTITSAGPLRNIGVSTELNCSVDNRFFENTACVTEVASGSYLFGPSNIPGGNNPGGFYPVSQSKPDPYTVVTVVDTAAYSLRVTETDVYVPGQNLYTTTINVANNGTKERDVVLYRGGDCFAGGNDSGLGTTGNPDGAVSCVNNGVTEQWIPLVGASNYIEGFYGDFWSAMNAGTPFPDSCDCGVKEDNAAGLSWSMTLKPGKSVTVEHSTYLG